MMLTKIMGRDIESLRWIVIPPKDLGRVVNEDKTEVTPRNKDWLLSDQRSWAEISTYLQNTLKGLQDNFSSSEPKDKEVRRDYGLKEAVGDNLSLLLAYVDLVDEQRLLKEGYLRRAELERKAYEKEKDEIDSMNLSRVRKIEKKAEAYARHRVEIEKYTEKSQEYKQIEDFVLKKAVLDFFSWQGNSTETGEPLVIQNFAKLVNEAREKFDDPSSSASEHFKQRKPIEYFLGAVSRFMQNTDDQPLFMQYAYRQSQDLVTQKEDCEVLEAMLVFAFDTHQTTDSPETQKQLELLGKSYFVFLKRRCSASQAEDQYPHLSLLYDFMVVTCYQERPEVITKAARYLDQLFGDLLETKSLNQEIQLFAQHCAPFYQPPNNQFYKFISQYKDRIKSMSDSERKQAREDFLKMPNFKDILNFRIFSSLLMLADSKTNHQGLFFGNSIVIENIGKKLVSFLEKLGLNIHVVDSTKDYYESLFKEYHKISTYFSWLSGANLNLDLLIMPLKIPNLNNTADNIKFHDYFDLAHKRVLDAHNKISILGEWIKNNKDKYQLSINYYADFIRLYCAGFWNEEFSSSIEKENDFLWNEVLDNSEWFVSPRGDRFHQDNDPQLATKAVESITFRVDKNHPREHQIMLKIMGIEEPFEFWLDTKRNLLGKDRTNLIIDPKSRQFLINFLLKRLYYITSGLLSEEQKKKDRVKDAETGKLIFLYRRPYYAHLFSTEFRRITLESRSAVFHAREILEKYGIDIYAENRRRRALGDLKPNEFITYVDEISSDIRSLVLVPNDLTFRPELLNLPIL